MEGNRQELYQLAMARSDIAAALTTARYIREHLVDIRHPLWVPLQDSVVVSYARPFTGNRPFGRLPEEYERFEDEAFSTLHHELILLRNKTIAHSDADIRRVLVVPEGARFIPEGSQGLVVSTKKLAPHRFAEIEQLCLYLGRLLNRRCEELAATFLSTTENVHAFDLLSGDKVE